MECSLDAQGDLISKANLHPLHPLHSIHILFPWDAFMERIPLYNLQPAVLLALTRGQGLCRGAGGEEEPNLLI